MTISRRCYLYDEDFQIWKGGLYIDRGPYWCYMKFTQSKKQLLQISHTTNVTAKSCYRVWFQMMQI